MSSSKPPEAPVLLDVPQAAAVLGISEKLVYRLAAAGCLPVKRLGTKLVRFPREALLEWAAAPDARK